MLDTLYGVDVSEIAGNEAYAVQDARYDEFRVANPDVSYATFVMSDIAQRMKKGATHNSLGTNLKRPSGKTEEFREAGRGKAGKYMKLSGITPEQRVCDYGCGSLRIGVHFIERQEKGCFYGIDVTDGFYTIGKGLVGEDLISEKEVRLGVISTDEIDRVAAFAPSLVYSSAVVCHVRPEEMEFFFTSVERIAHTPGAIVLLDVHLAEVPTRYAHRSWAWPMELYERAMPGLTLHEVHSPRPNPKKGFEIGQAVIEWRRA